jgi:hypothetical protein
MFIRVCRANRVFGVHAVRQSDVYGVDVFIRGDLVVVAVAVDVLRRHVVLGGVFLRLLAMPAHERHNFRLLRRLARRHKVPERDPPQAHDTEPGLLRPLLALGHPSSKRRKSGPGEQIARERAAGDGHVLYQYHCSFPRDVTDASGIQS